MKITLSENESPQDIPFLWELNNDDPAGTIEVAPGATVEVDMERTDREYVAGLLIQHEKWLPADRDAQALVDELAKLAAAVAGDDTIGEHDDVRGALHELAAIRDEPDEAPAIVEDLHDDEAPAIVEEHDEDGD